MACIVECMECMCACVCGVCVCVCVCAQVHGSACTHLVTL